MVTLLIEHAISDFATWCGAFDRFAEARRDAGVTAEHVLRPVDDPHYVDEAKKQGNDQRTHYYRGGYNSSFAA